MSGANIDRYDIIYTFDPHSSCSWPYSYFSQNQGYSEAFENTGETGLGHCSRFYCQIKGQNPVFSGRQACPNLICRYI
jgi:hypothetical protein